MAQAQRFRLKLSRLDFVSLVDDPAQPNAKTLLLKRRGSATDIEARAKFIKAAEDLGLAFFWAFTSTNSDGTDHYDLHGDTIEGDFIKAAMEFMLDGGGAVDEMHDGESTDGRVVFAFPMTPEIAKAFGVATKTTGLMVALKVTPEQLTKLKDGTYSGVSIAGLGTREPVRARKSADKRYLTDEVLGHQHEASVYDDGGSAWMTDATAEGAQAPHRHTVIRDESGQLVVLADSGHTHTLTESPIVIVAPDDATVVPESVAARAKHESPRASKSRSMTITKENAVDELAELKALKEKLEAKIAELEAQLVEARTDAELTDEEKAHLAGLSTSEAKRFRSLEKSARSAEVEKRRAVEYTADDGTVYRKCDDPRLVAMAKRADEAERLRIEAEVSKRVGEFFKGAPGRPSALRDLLKAIESIPGEVEIEVETKVDGRTVKSAKTVKRSDECATALKALVTGAVESLARKGKAPGFDGGDGSPPSDDPNQAFDAGLAEYAKSAGAKHPYDAYEAFMRTEKGKTLKAAYNASIGK